MITDRVQGLGDQLNAKRVSHDDAVAIVSRLVAAAFRRDGERLSDDRRPRLSIPARPDRDDDLRIAAYVDQQREITSELLTALRRIEELATDTPDPETFEEALDAIKAECERAILKAEGRQP